MFDDTTAPRVPVQEADPVVLSDDAPEDAAREPDLDAGEMTSDAAELPSFVTDAPAPNLTVVETAPEIGVTEQPPAFDASHAPEPEPEPEVIEEAPMAVDVDPEPEDAALPAFLHPAPAKEASDTEEPAADPIDAVSEQDIRTAPELPSFTRSTETPEEEPTLDAPEPQDSAPDPFETAPQELAQEDVPEPAAASLVVDAPDPVDAELVAKPAAMSAAIRTKKLTPEQRSAILPLVARLAAHRDQLAAGGAQSGWL